MNEKAKIRFLNWLEDNDPFAYKVVMERYKLKKGQNLNGVMDNVGDIFNSAVDTVKNVLPSVMNYKQQKKIMDIQIERAKRGEAPIDAEQYTPPVGVEVGVSAEGEEAAKRIASDTLRQGIGDMKPYFFGGLAIALFLLMKNRR